MPKGGRFAPWPALRLRNNEGSISWKRALAVTAEAEAKFLCLGQRARLYNRFEPPT